MDISQANAEQAEVWAAYHRGSPTRVPMSISANQRMLLLDPALNAQGHTFKDCYDDPDIMFDVDLAFQYWFRHNVPGDFEHGLPAQWAVGPHFMNYAESAWFGAKIYFLEGEVPDTRPFLTDDKKRMLFDQGIPDPFAGIMGRARDFLDHFRARAARETFYDRPITVADASPGLNNDGPFTIACNLRGATDFCLDIYEDPEYAAELLAFITEATITRQRAWRAYFGMPPVMEGAGFADDSIALISTDVYKDLVLPFHRRFATEDCTLGAAVGIHLCGDASRHFVTLRDELGMISIDTGFPIDHGQIRRDLGPDVQIMGGPHVDLLLHGTPEEVVEETRRILHSGVMEGGKFILKEANNLAPRTPMANLQAMYDTCKREGVYHSATV